ncbi:MAG: 4-(cytidine 5'-diphospho)-2-C-methyl-D-erythritol kinase [Lachnospiraceae bacterium]|nr:4-(cytidine 5'-diphospho)-2-C-methyl-D-erythritol kinase [Lachnospiraceae bacterium]
MENSKQTLTLEAHAKINLSLDVVGLREDGYHLVKMVMQSLSLCDELTMTLLPEDEIRLSVDVPGLECDERNLIWKAVALIKETYHIDKGMEIQLKKRIPMAAGLAGGSSDCAAALKGASELFGLSLSPDQLAQLGVQLGADVPYCLLGKTALSEGIGEVLTVLPTLPDCGILLAKPSMGVSTDGVYKALDALSGYDHPDTEGILRALEAGDLSGVTERLCNVLELVTIARHPEIDALKDKIRGTGAMGTLMSGSGPTVFGIYEDVSKADRAAARLSEGGFNGQVFTARPV